MKRVVVVLLLGMSLPLTFTSSVAVAHEGEDQPAKTLSQQAIALRRSDHTARLFRRRTGCPQLGAAGVDQDPR